MSKEVKENPKDYISWAYRCGVCAKWKHITREKDTFVFPPECCGESMVKKYYENPQPQELKAN